MSCAVCTGSVERLFLALEGVARAEVALPTSTARVAFAGGAGEARALAEECAAAVTRGGYACEVLSVHDGGGDGRGGGTSLMDGAARMERTRRAELDDWR